MGAPLARLDESITLNTFTAVAGPRFGFATSGTIQAGDSVAVRLGADFQMFFDEGENVKALRLGVGLTF